MVDRSLWSPTVPISQPRTSSGPEASGYRPHIPGADKYTAPTAACATTPKFMPKPTRVPFQVVLSHEADGCSIEATGGVEDVGAERCASFFDRAGGEAVDDLVVFGDDLPNIRHAASMQRA